MKMILPVVFSLLVIGVCAIVQGTYTDRWAPMPTTDMQLEFAERLKKLPTKLGPWESEEAATDAAQIKQAHIVGAYSRLFRNPRGDVVNLFIVCGPSRHISLHTPDQCYLGAGFTMPEEERKHTTDLGDQRAEFSTALFTKTDVTGDQNLRIFWSWSHDGTWQTPTTPRIAFNGLPGLYKMYAITSAPRGQTSPEDSPSIDFMREYLPEITKVLFPEEQPAEVETTVDSTVAAK